MRCTRRRSSPRCRGCISRRRRDRGLGDGRTDEARVAHEVAITSPPSARSCATPAPARRRRRSFGVLRHQFRWRDGRRGRSGPPSLPPTFSTVVAGAGHAARELRDGGGVSRASGTPSRTRRSARANTAAASLDRVTGRRRARRRACPPRLRALGLADLERPVLRRQHGDARRVGREGADLRLDILAARVRAEPELAADGERLPRHAPAPAATQRPPSLQAMPSAPRG